MLADPFDRETLPVRITFGTVDAENVDTSVDQRGHTLGIIAGIDACAHHIALVGIQHFKRIGFVRIVVLAEHKIEQVVFVVHDGQRVQLVVPDDVVGRLERRVRRSNDHAIARRHEVRNDFVHAHAGKTVITFGDDAKELSVAGAIFRNRHRRMTVFLLQSDHVSKRHVRTKVSIARHEARLVVLHATDHGSLILDGLRPVDEGKAAFRGQRDSHTVVRNGLHDSGNHRNAQRNGRLFTLLVLHQRSFQAHRRRNVFRCGKTRNEQILVKRTRRFIEIVGHERAPLLSDESVIFIL